MDAAFAQLGAACEAVRDARRRTRPVLTISASHSVASLWLAPLLAAFAAQHPSVQWKVHSTEQEPDMLREGLDLAILRARPGALADGDTKLFSETVFPVCSPSLRLRGQADELLRHNLLEEDHGTSPEKGWATWLDLLGLGAGAKVTIVRFSTFHAALAAAVAGRRHRAGAAAADRFRAGERAAGASVRRPVAARVVGHDHPPPPRRRARRARGGSCRSFLLRSVAAGVSRRNRRRLPCRAEQRSAFRHLWLPSTQAFAGAAQAAECAALFRPTLPVGMLDGFSRHCNGPAA